MAGIGTATPIRCGAAEFADPQVPYFGGVKPAAKFWFG
jgi:hypothetical protein